MTIDEIAAEPAPPLDELKKLREEAVWRLLEFQSDKDDEREAFCKKVIALIDDILAGKIFYGEQ